MQSSDKTTKPSENKTGKTSSNASFVVSVAILLSRILGLVREQVFAHYLGNSDAAGAFKAALRIPNFLQNLFGEGVLSASFIPVYSRLQAQGDRENARAVAGIVGAILALAVSFFVLAGVGLTPWFVDLVAPGFSGDLRLLTIRIVRILFPGVGLLVLSAWCLGILNSHRKFFLSYIAPVFWNLAMITCLVFYGRSATENELVVGLAWAAVIGSCLQLGVQLPFVFRYAGAMKFRIRRSGHVIEVFRSLGPVLLSRGVVQVSAYVDGIIASFLGAAAVTSLGYTQTIYLLPVSLFGMAVAAAELPEMSASADGSEEAKTKLRLRLASGRRRIAFFVIPSLVAFLFLGRYLVCLLYQTGKFGPEDTLYVWYILIGSVIGLLAATWGRLYSSAFYALRDTRTPLLFAMIRVALTVGLGLLFAFPARPLLNSLFSTLPGLRLPELSGIELGMGAVGLTSSAGLAGWVEFILLKRALEKRIGPTAVSASIIGKIWASALVAAAFALVITYALKNTEPALGHQRFFAVVPLASFSVFYLALTFLLKVSELNSLLRRFARRP